MCANALCKTIVVLESCMFPGNESGAREVSLTPALSVHKHAFVDSCLGWMFLSIIQQPVYSIDNGSFTVIQTNSCMG